MELFFTTSGMLWLLPVATLPVVFHIHARTKERAVDFPGAFFLVNPALPSAERRRQIEDIALLLFRVVLIAAAILALSGPRVKGWAVAPSSTESGREAIVLVLDDSPSSCLPRVDEGLDWRASLGRMAEILAADERRRVSLETASGTGWPLETVRSFSARLRQTRPQSSVSGDRALALTRALQVLGEVTEERRAIVLLTDLRRNRAEGEGEELLARWSSALGLFAQPDAPALIVMKSGRAPERQWCLETTGPSGREAASERVPVAGQPFRARVRARCVTGAGRRVLIVETAPWRFDGTDARENVPPERVLERPLILAENEVAEIEIPLLRPEPAALWIGARFDDTDEWPYDDTVEMALRIRPKRVAVLWDARRAHPAAEQDRALQSTLFALDPLAGAENGRVALTRRDEPRAADAQPGALVAILYDPSGLRLSQALSEQLRGAVERGACVLWIPDLTGDPGAWPEPLPNRVVASDPLLPRAIEGGEAQRNPAMAEAWRMADAQTDHPLLRPFSGGRNGDLPGLHLRRRVRLALTAASAEAQTRERVLARFNDGLPALLVRRLGSGWTGQLAFGVEPEGGLAESPAWPVLLSEFLELAADDTFLADSAETLTPGGVGGSTWLIAPAETARTIRLAGPWHPRPGELLTAPTRRWTFEVPPRASQWLMPPLPETGLYRLHAGGKTQRFLECRIAHEESAVEAMPEEVCRAITAAARKSGGTVIEGTGSLAEALAGLQPGRPLAPYCWLLFGLLMSLELGLLIWRGRSA